MELYSPGIGGSRKSIAIATPSTGAWHSEMGVCLAQLCMYSVLFHDIAVLDGRHGSSTSDGRNRLVLGARAAEVDGILWIDSDMQFPADGLVRLLRHGREMVGATYARRAPPYDVFNRLPTGFLYTAMSVFEKIEPPWFYEEIDWAGRDARNIAGTITEDMVFHRRATEAGIEPVIDHELTYAIVHIGKQFIRVAPQSEAV